MLCIIISWFFTAPMFLLRWGRAPSPPFRSVPNKKNRSVRKSWWSNSWKCRWKTIPWKLKFSPRCRGAFRGWRIWWCFSLGWFLDSVGKKPGILLKEKTKKLQFFLGLLGENLFRKEPSITADSRYLWVSFLLLSYDYTMRRFFHHSDHHHNYFHTATRTFFHWAWWRSKTVANASPYHCSSLTKPCQKLQAGTGFFKGWSSLQWVPQRELRNSQSCYMESISSWWF